MYLTLCNILMVNDKYNMLLNIQYILWIQIPNDFAKKNTFNEKSIRKNKLEINLNDFLFKHPY